MNDFEGQLTARLTERADRTNLTIDREHVKTGRSQARRVASDPWAPRVLVAAAAVLLTVVGLVGITQLRTAEPQQTTQPPPPDPYQALPREGPSLDDHWHVPYGINICGEWIQLDGDLEEISETGQPSNDNYLANGIHSHGDGLIHIHPFSSAGTGDNATIGTFLTNYGVELTDETLRLPANQADGVELSEFANECDDQDSSLAIVVWPNPTDPLNKVVVTEQIAGTPLGADGIVVAIAFTNDATSIEMPPSVIDAETNASIDEGLPRSAAPSRD